MLVTFMNPDAGIAGAVAALLSVFVSRFTGLDKESVHSGFYSYNALLCGIGLGTFYVPEGFFWLIVFAAALLSTMLTASLSGVFSKYRLPVLSLPFVLCFWVLMLSTRDYSAFRLNERSIYWINAMYADGGEHLLAFVSYFEYNKWPTELNQFLLAMSALFFQNSVLSGLILSIALLLWSRIGFSLAVLSFLFTRLFHDWLGVSPNTVNYYHVGSNFMMAAIAIGGFFTVPSWRSYLWALWSIPIVSVLVTGFSRLLAPLAVPAFSLPFCVVVLLFIHLLLLRSKQGKLHLVQVQQFSPEKNLYAYVNGSERLRNLIYYRLQLPFIGEWTVSQGHDGGITHKGDWSKAFDFVILDEQMKTYQGMGSRAEDYYCYQKPVLAPADGWVSEVLDGIPDNPVGAVNTERNWGNSIVLYHGPGVYSKFSHLQSGSIRHKPGDTVRRSEVIGLVGNSGRSPEPHLHFQIQATPYIGSKTISYPIALFSEGKDQKLLFFDYPHEGSLVSNPEENTLLSQFFFIQPGRRFEWNILYHDGKKSVEKWEAITDAWNYTCLREEGSSALAYFISHRDEWMFTSFHGSESTFLFQFYKSLYHLVLSFRQGRELMDEFPIKSSPWHLLSFLQDLVAPFYRFAAEEFLVKMVSSDDPFHPSKIILHTECSSRFLNIRTATMKAEITIQRNAGLSIKIFRKQKWFCTAECSVN
jgi:urea transporter/murein DD-endopeptidase MepM/ murein hydrolase activator NlpD